MRKKNFPRCFTVVISCTSSSDDKKNCIKIWFVISMVFLVLHLHSYRSKKKYVSTSTCQDITHARWKRSVFSVIISHLMLLTQYQMQERCKICQTLSWWTKNLPHSVNIWDVIRIHVVPMYSLSQAPSCEPKFILLAWFLQELAYLNMLLILELACTAGQLKNK